MTRSTVLLVEDQDMIREVTQAVLEEDGFDVVTAVSGRDLLNRLHELSFDIVLLDLVLPDADGLDLIAKIRERTDVPIIIISSKAEMGDKVVGLERGADDYVSKPLPMKELSSRIKAHLRRYNRASGLLEPSAKIKFGRWTLDMSKHQVFDEHGQSCGLTAMEFRLLEALVSAPNRVLTRERILEHVRTDNADVTDRAVDVQIMRIRRKIGDTDPENQMIQTVRGAGYMFTGAQ